MERKRNAYGRVDAKVTKAPLPDKTKIRAEEKLLRENERKLQTEQQRIADAFKTLQSLGFKIEVPTTEEDLAHHKESLQKLGIVSNEPKILRSASPKELTAFLQNRHVIAGNIYGPGEITLTPSETSLFRSLLEQDQRCTQALRDTSEYVTHNKCYMIKSGKGRDRHNKYSKVEVSSDFFNSPQFNDATSFEVTPTDAAGYRGTT